MKTKILLILSLLLISDISIAEANTKNIDQKTHPEIKRKPSIKAMAIGVAKAEVAIKCDPFSPQSIWNQNYLSKETEIADKIKKFLSGEYARKAKELAFEDNTKEEVIEKLIKNGFKKCEVEGRMDGLLGKAKDREFQDAGEIYIHEDGSIIRIKDASSKRHIRPQAYLIKAALKNQAGPATWQNEAFKISKEGFPVPKGPKTNQGMLTHAPSSSGIDEDKGWIDLIMEEVHIDIK